MVFVINNISIYQISTVYPMVFDIWFLWSKTRIPVFYHDITIITAIWGLLNDAVLTAFSAAPGAQAIFAALESNGTVELGDLQLPLSVQDFRWIGFVGKILIGNHRFSHEDHGVFRLTFSLKPLKDLHSWRNPWFSRVERTVGPLFHLWGIPSFVLGELSQLQTMIVVVQSQSIPCFITIFRYFHHHL